jgi:mRNA-degrading endonuclease RelE of RelBE toxin-antitoxin system
MYEITYLVEAEEDLANLPDEILSEVLNYIEKYKTEPFKYGKKLYDYKDTKLEGYLATYVAGATYRIVYCVEDGIAKIVEVVAVGERKDKQVYLQAHKRISQK